MVREHSRQKCTYMPAASRHLTLASQNRLAVVDAISHDTMAVLSSCGNVFTGSVVRISWHAAVHLAFSSWPCSWTLRNSHRSAGFGTLWRTRCCPADCWVMSRHQVDGLRPWILVIAAVFTLGGKLHVVWLLLVGCIHSRTTCSLLLIIMKSMHLHTSQRRDPLLKAFRRLIENHLQLMADDNSS